jgi:hypothetical protein
MAELTEANSVLQTTLSAFQAVPQLSAAAQRVVQRINR